MLKEKLKNNKGITLIALIITIIVMLILVVVTVSVALNGGIFDQARTAAKDTQKESDRETLQAALVGAYDAVTGEIDAEKLEKNLGDEWTVTEEENSSGEKIITCLKQNDSAETTTTTFEVSMNGTITVAPDSTIEPEVPETVDLSGLYYGSEEGDVYEGLLIENDICYLDGSTKQSPATQMEVDTQNKTLTVTVDTQSVVFEYDLLKENDEVVNKILFRRDEDTQKISSIMWQNKDGFPEGELSGLYSCNDFYAMIFDPDTLTYDYKMNKEQDTIDNLTNWSFVHKGEDNFFFYYEGVYYIDRGPLTALEFENGMETLKYGSDVYNKVQPSN